VKHALAALVLAGCWTSSPPPPSPGVPFSPLHTKKTSMPVADEAPLELIVTEGTPEMLPDGTTVNARGILYAHLTNGGNLSAATLTFVLDTSSAEVSLSRRGDEPEADRWKPALGWEVRLEFADPYHQPSTASITVRRPRP
jgi:hypothetical protein